MKIIIVTTVVIFWYAVAVWLTYKIAQWFERNS